MKEKRRVWALGLCLLLLAALMPAAPGGTAQAAGYMKSGDLSMPKLSEAEIAAMVKTEHIDNPLEPFSAKPSVESPYSLGALTPATLQGGLNRLNVIRRIAGVPPVTLDTDFCTYAQHSAVVNAAWGDSLDHYPPRPDGMDYGFWMTAYQASQRCNLAEFPDNSGTRFHDGILAYAVDMWMKDQDDEFERNLSTVGHRRWLINPATGKVGFGAAKGLYWQFADMYWVSEYAHDESGAGCDYDFIAWPSSGNFATTKRLFNNKFPWSVSLNPEKYATPSLASTVVTLKRESDGRTWTFSGNQTYRESAEDRLYFTINTEYMGIPNCIIFRPHMEETYASCGLFTVTITGIKTAGGADTSIAYQVNFFDPTPYWEAIDAGQAPASAAATPAAATPPLDPDLPFSDIPANAWYRDFAKSVYQAGLMGGSGDRFNPAGTLSVAEAVTLAARMHASASGAQVPDREGAWYQGALDYVLQNDLVDPAFRALLADMNRPATRYEMVALLDRAVPPSRWTNAVPEPHIPDVRETEEPYGPIVYGWYRAGVVSGGSDGSFNGGSNITRAEVAKILCQLNALA